jgi:regulator of nucleoside diphosphate kinase
MEMTMNDRQIEISEPNARVLRGLLRTRNGATHDQEHLDDLRVELDRALVMDPGSLSPSVVTMYAAVRVRDLESGHRHQLTLVSPSEADVSAGRISVLAPLGTALLGYREGDVVERVMPGGLRRVLIEEVRQQSATDGFATAQTQGAASIH